MEENEVKNTINSNEVENQSNQSTGNGTKKTKKINVCCLLSFIFAMVGILVFGLFCGLAALILGIIGVVKFKKEEQDLRWMGIAGLIIGAIEFVVMTINMIINIYAISAIL